MATQRAKRSSDTSVVKLKLVPDQSDKIPPQMKEILFCLDDNGGTQTIGCLMPLLEESLSTKQPAKAVWKHYKKQMTEGGWITIE